MLRQHIGAPEKSDFHHYKIHMAGEVVKQGSYVCWHCRRPTVMEDSKALQLCPACFGRHFTPQ